MILNSKLQTLTTIEGKETGPAKWRQCLTGKKKTFSQKKEKLHTLKTSNGQKTLPLHACTDIIMFHSCHYVKRSPPQQNKEMQLEG